MNYEENRLHQTLIKLRKDFTNNDYFEYRKNRDWKKFDAMTPVGRLMHIIKEVKEYKNGYFEEDNFSADEPEIEQNTDDY